MYIFYCFNAGTIRNRIILNTFNLIYCIICPSFSDKKLTEILESCNIHIARRTVAKYREMMGILPSSKRKQF